MSNDIILDSGAVRRYLWCVRRYAWLVLATTVALAAAPLVYTFQPAVYSTEALVVGRQVGIDTVALPRLADAVFESGVVARAVLTHPVLPPYTGPLIPDRIELLAAEDSVVFKVVGRDPDPARAAMVANIAAEAFTSEMNRPGGEVGSFAVQTAALVPSEPEGRISSAVAAGWGAGAGILLGLGLVAVAATVRRPVIDSADIEAATGSRLLGSVVLRPRGRTPQPETVPGILPVIRVITGLPDCVIVFASDEKTARIRSRVVEVLGSALQRISRGPRTDSARPADRAHNALPGGGHVDTASGTRPTEPTLVDGLSALAETGDASLDVRVVLVVRLGTASGAVQSAVQDVPREELLGVLLVDVQRGRRRGDTEHQPGTFVDSGSGERDAAALRSMT